MEFFQYIAAIAGISSIFVISIKPDYIRLGLFLNVIASLLFGTHALVTSQWGILTAQSCYFIISLIGVIKRGKVSASG